jgi:hypothetical protein
VSQISIKPPVNQAATEQAAVWPMTIGVLGITFSTFGIMGGCVTIAAPWIIRAFAEKMPEKDRATLTMFDQWTSWIVIDAVAWLVLSIAMVIACINLMRHRGSSRSLILIWAILKIGYSLGDSVLSYVMATSAFSQSENASPAPGGFLGLVGISGAVLNFLFYAALPVVMIIWFSRTKIKSEMATWPK